MQAIVMHPVLEGTALFGSGDFPIPRQADGSYGPIEPTTLTAPDFALQVAAIDTLAGTLPVKLLLRGANQLPFVLPDLDTSLRYRIEDQKFIFEGLDQVSIPIPGGAGLDRAIHLEASTLSIAIGLEGWNAELKPTQDSQAYVASVHIGEIEFLVTQLAFAQSGVTACSASLRQRKVTFANRPIELLSGTLTVLGNRISAVIEARLSIEGLSNAHIDLTITSSGDGGEWQLNAVARTPTIESWTDPSGYLHFENMSVSWLIGYRGGVIEGELSASGRLQFAGDKLSDQAKEWLSELFQGLSADFTDVRLGQWSQPDFLKFRPLSSLKVKALDVFDMQIPSIAISSAGLDLEELTLAFHAGGASIRASLPRLAINLNGADKRIDLKLGADELNLNVELTVPAGIKAYGALRYQNTATLQALSGNARFSTPTLPGVEVMFTIGRKRFGKEDRWDPLLLLYADVPVTLPVFPGIVIQRLGLGAAVNFAVDGVTGLSFAETARRVRSGSLPDVAREMSWVPKLGDFTLAARAFAGPNPGSQESGHQLYIADLTFVMASDFQLAAYLKMWFQTSIEDAKDSRFQQKPAVVGLATFDGNEPSLRLIAMTQSDGLSSLEESSAAGKLLTFKLPETRLAFEANARGMAVMIGPNTMAGEIGPLKLSAQTTLAVRAMDRSVFVVYRNSLSAGFHIGGSLDVGMARFSASVTAAFSAQMELWGLANAEQLTVYGEARATFLVEVALHVRIGFRIEISYGFGSIEIECYHHWDFGLQVHIDLSLAVAISTRDAPGVLGRGTIGVNVLGMSVAVSLPLESHGDAVMAARASYKKEIEGHLNALGGN